MISPEANGFRKTQIKEQLETLSEIKRDMDSFLDLLKVKMALSSQISNSNIVLDEDLAISNIELVS